MAEFEHENGGFNQPALWPDIAAMLEDVASALRTGRWVHPNIPHYDLVPVSRHPGRRPGRNLRAHVALLDGTWSDKDIMAQLGISAAELVDVRAENERFMQEQRRAAEQRQREAEKRWLEEHRPGEQQRRPGG